MDLITQATSKRYIMKKHNIILLSILALCSAVSCVNEMGPNGGTYANKGELVLSVNANTPATKAVTQVDDYPVIIKNAADVVIFSYETVQEVPEKILLDVGYYNVESHTPGQMQKKMTSPYYGGESKVEIKTGISSKAEVTCTMQNTKIAVNYGQEFTEVFKSWTITIDDGSTTALVFNHKDPRSNGQTVFYWHFDNNVCKVTLNFVGQTHDGSTISQRYDISKSQIEHGGYDNDSECFTGGDALSFTFTPQESTTGTIDSISMQISIAFDESGEDINVDVTDDPQYDPEPEPGPGPEPAENTIVLSMPAPITLPEADTSKGDVSISTPDGIKSLKVHVTSTSGDMIGALEEVANQYEGVDLVGGCEVVDNQNLVSFLGNLGNELSVPTKGDKNYTFPVGQFFGFLVVLPGEHSFHMDVIDMVGNKKSGTLVITVP